MEILQQLQTYLFGDSQFLKFLGILMLADIATGILKAIKLRRLKSATAWHGYLRKIAVFVIIIVANVLDVMLGLRGAMATMTIMFYCSTEAWSIIENCSELGLRIPNEIIEKLSKYKED